MLHGNHFRHGAIFCQGGSGLGNVLYRNKNFVTGDDVKINAMYGTFSYYTKPIIKDPKKFLIVLYVRVAVYKGGEGSVFWKPEKFRQSAVLNYNIRSSMIEGEHLPSIISIMCPYRSLRRGEAKISADSKYVPGLLLKQHSILRQWRAMSFDKTVHVANKALPHYLFAPYYNLLYSFSELNSAPPVSPVRSRSFTGEWNEVTWQSKQLVFDAVSGLEKQCIKSSDHFNQDLTDDGIKHRRLEDMVTDQFAKTDLKYDIIVL